MPPNVRPKKRASAITSSRECEEFFHTVPEFERMLVRSGIILIKYWFYGPRAKSAGAMSGSAS